MKWSSIRTQDLETIITKLGLERTSSRRGPERVFWYYLDGKRQLRITLPNVHGGSGSISPGFLGQIKKSLRLTSQQLVDLVQCPLSADEFEALLRSRLNLG